MNLSHPEFDAFGENEGRVLRRLSVLAEGTTGRKVHELAGVTSLRTTQMILERLTNIGLVDMRPVGSANVYSLNREHALWEPIQKVLALPAIVEEQIAEILSVAFGKGLVGAALYGSFARGEADADSDVDILIVHADGDLARDFVDAIDATSEAIQVLTGNTAQLLPVSLSELRNLVLHDDPLVRSLRADARSLVDGFELSKILQKGRLS
jgi:predicted nucleotidyltransferase